MILHVIFMEQQQQQHHHQQRMQTKEPGQKRAREAPDLTEQQPDFASRRRGADMFKAAEELMNEFSSYGGVSASQDAPVQQQEQQQTRQQQVEDESGTSRVVNYGHMIGPLSTDFGVTNQWGRESSSQIYRRLDAETSGEERRMRDEAAVNLSKLWSRRDDADIQMSISARTLRPSGGKDRHSKVFTAKGPRDRRVRLSVSTAIQFYDVQDRLGYDQPSKAVEWLMKKAKNAIDELSHIPLPGLDRLPSSLHHRQHHTLEAPPLHQHHQSGSWQCENLHCGPPELKNQSSTSEHHLSTVPTPPRSSFPFRTQQQVRQEQQQQQVHQEQQQQVQEQQVHSSPFRQNGSAQREWKAMLLQPASTFSAGTSSPAVFQQQQQQQQEGDQQHLVPAPGEHRQAFYPTPPGPSGLQYHQQTSLITVQQTYLQQQEFLAAGLRPPLFPFQAITPAAPPPVDAFSHQAKPYMDHSTMPSQAASRLLNAFGTGNRLAETAAAAVPLQFESDEGDRPSSSS